MFIVIIFVIAKKQKNHNFLPQEIGKLWYIHSMEYYLAIKINNVPIHAMIWMNLKNIMLSESSQTQKATFSMIPFI